jgi:GAF domain-containing protein
MTNELETLRRELAATRAELAEARREQATTARDLEETLAYQAATSDVLRAIATSMADPQQVFERIVDAMERLLPHKHLAVFLSPGDGYVHVAARRGKDLQSFDDVYPLPLSDSASGQMPAGERQVYFAHILDNPAAPASLRRLTETAGDFSDVITRMIWQGRAIGSIAVTREPHAGFSERERALLRTFADQAVIAIENARLFREVQARTKDLSEALRRQTATSDVLRAIAASPGNVQPVLDRLVETVCALCEASDAVIMLRDGGDLWTPSHHGPIPVPPNAGRRPISRDWPPGRAVAEGRTIHVHDLADAQDEYPLAVVISADVAREASQGAPQPGLAWRTALIAPLMREGEALGNIVLRRVEVSPFSDAQIALLQTFADQAVIAIDNARLFREVNAKTRDLEESLAQQTATADVLKVISRSAFDLQAVLDTLISSAVKLCAVDNGLIYLKRDDAFYIRAHDNPAEDAAFVELLKTRPQYPGRGSIGARVLLTGEVQQIPDNQIDPDFDPALRAAIVNRALVGVPMKRDGAVVGAITLARRKPGEYSDRHIELLQTFADQAVIAIENARLLDEVQARTRALEKALERQTATAEILKVIASAPADVQPVFDAIVMSAKRLLGAKDSVLTQIIGDKSHLVAFTPTNPESDAARRASFPRSYEDPVVGAIIAGQSVLIADTETAESANTWRQTARTTGNRSVAVVPLMSQGRSIGALAVARAEPGAFAEEGLDLLRTFADQAVIAVENARLLNDIKESLAQQTATADVLKVISRSGADLEVMLQKLADTAGSFYGNSCIHLQQDGLMKLRVHFGGTPDWIAYLNKRPFPATQATQIGRAWVTGEIVHVPDIPSETDLPWGRAAAISGYRSTISVPIVSRSHGVVGVFSYGSSVTHGFPPRRIELLKSFADQAAIAIDNARLLDEVQARTRELEESLAQQTATADLLKVISRSAFDLEPALANVCETAARLCGADRAAIYRREGDLYRFAASYGFPAEYVNAWRAAGATRIDPASPLVGHRALTERRIVQVLDVTADPAFFATTSRAADARTSLGVPLLREGEPVGNFVLARTRVEAYSPRQLELIQTFADQAVIAIENARLIEEVQARTRDLSEALQQQTATADVLKVISRSAFDLQKVLDTLVGSAAGLCEAEKACIFQRRGDLYHWVSNFGFSDELIAYAEGHPFAAGGGSVTSRVVRDRAPVHIPDVLADPNYEASEYQRLGEYRTMLGVPLLRDSEPIGVFIMTRHAVRPFNPRQIELLETFADQAVIAIENARLFEEVQSRTRDLSEALEQQTATANVLQAISRSVFDLETVLQTLIDTAVKLARGSRGTIFIKQGEVLIARAFHSHVPEELRKYLAGETWRIDGDSYMARAAREGIVVHVPDLTLSEKVSDREVRKRAAFGAALWTPLVRDGEVIGIFGVPREQPIAFTAREIELVQTFADQAVIAIENSRLFGEVQTRTRELEQSLDDLRKAQDRLVQTEKLASLGQLTAGIAHEIKNPLNFVNNFSALSRELLGELKEVIDAHPPPPGPRADIDDLLAMLDSNLDKVVHHGQRADSIVKNMLRHSREGSSERARVNVNAMVEEALNLAYHGARAERPGFNVTIERHLDSEAGEVDLHVQEMTRVLLNLASNGFYATEQRKRGEAGGYEPTLTAATRDLGDHVEIRVRDNGAGIPDEVKQKMFNPFFTTKPAGEGTGLGLSLSHDIVVKQHGGTIDAATELGAYTEFVITLPRRVARDL